MMAKFYSKDPERGGCLTSGHRAVSQLPLNQTVPAFCFWLAFNGPLWLLAEGRSMYWKMLAFGTVTGWFWMAIRS